ncbi:hypothetical protein CHU95_19345 [Niveispirillum lacus]|uniref:Uncharacterized protein n=1 Tax=Niveispirillum lacus TaxID=1981099 RepID=A0A255YWU6_9PROT|nr:hypothetical protein [Niveispirillum lacus]OYQ32890.1 hypothetical protein CHU95_19345 [Niveispirillum lacus]
MKELRCILFKDREVLSAILDRKRRLKEELPAGQITGLSLNSVDESINCTITYDNGHHSLTIPETELQAALLAHCMARKVPLPVDADKNVHLINGRATLMITINFNRAARLVHVAAAEKRALPV